ncbi:hypothetical protein D9756_009547 [Leucocoprinus leucothites]|uniref:Uncharacterized protein n=1 Tax=Leucocoprinus leucothites TaxID=201217 RepID=A0A8H5FTF1_9AGAR|nr:hypothetical protein D9756_009547 [Leucoagaricus leucothites]
MVDSHVVDLALFGKTYRTLFIIGEYVPCSDNPRADRLNMRGRMLLTDFVSGFYEIRKVTRSAVTMVRKLKVQAQLEIRAFKSAPQAQDHAKDIAQNLRSALEKLQSDGMKQLKDLGAKILEYRDEIVTPEVDALEAKIKGLEERRYGGIAAITNKITMKLISSNSETAVGQVSTLAIARSELSAAQEISSRATQTRFNMHTCTLNWERLYSDIRGIYYKEISDLLAAEDMTPQRRAKINEEFDVLLDVLLNLTKEMDRVYDVIEAEFGPDRDINRRVEAFRIALPRTSSILKQLSLSQNTVEKHYREQFLKEIRSLAKYALAQLRRVEGVLSSWMIYTGSGSTEPLSFIDDAHEMCTKTTEFFERNWRASATRLRAVLLTKGKKRGSKKNGNSDETEPSGILALSSSSEALRALDDLEETFFAITGFAIRFAMDLMFYDRRLQDETSPKNLSQLLVDPFDVSQDIAEKAHEKLEDEIARLLPVAGSDSD